MQLFICLNQGTQVKKGLFQSASLLKGCPADIQFYQYEQFRPYFNNCEVIQVNFDCSGTAVWQCIDVLPKTVFK